MEFAFSYCMECKRLEHGTEPVSGACRGCSSVGSYSVPLIFRVVPISFHREEDHLEEVLAQSFEEEMEPKNRPASSNMLEKMLGRHSFVKGEEECCSICLETMLGGEVCIETPCCHKTCHPACMERTLMVIPHCPFCRQIML